MIGLLSATLFAGYTLVYAAVANGGAFAASPWEALRRDAYDASSSSAAAASHRSSTFDRIVSGVAALLPALSPVALP